MRGGRATALDLRSAPPTVRHDRSESSSTGENADEDMDQPEPPADENAPREIGRHGSRSRDEEERGDRGSDRGDSRSDAALRKHLIALYKALGGGWSDSDEPPRSERVNP